MQIIMPRESKIKEMFDQIAPRYDLLNTLFSLSIDRKWRREAVSNITEPNLNVLDLCAGTLSLSRELLLRNPAAKITAVDFSQAMLRLGMERIPLRLRSQIKCLEADALHLLLPSNSFDVVMCAYGIRNLEDQNKAVTEMRRVLKKGGRLVILDFFKPDRATTKFFYATYARYLIPLLGGAISKNISAYKYLRESVKKFSSIPEFLSLLERHGFKDSKAQPQTMGISWLITASRPFA